MFALNQWQQCFHPKDWRNAIDAEDFFKCIDIQFFNTFFRPDVFVMQNSVADTHTADRTGQCSDFIAGLRDRCFIIFSLDEVYIVALHCLIFRNTLSADRNDIVNRIVLLPFLN